MAALGLFLVVFGLADVIGSFAGFDIWREYIGWTDMPDMLWRFSGYGETALGYFLMKSASSEGGQQASPADEPDDDEDDEDDEDDQD
mgnify:CR=1 FL=1